MIVLDENYRIETDKYNFSLKYEVENTGKDKDGKDKIVTTKDEWHFPELKMALNKYVNEAVKPCESVLGVILKLDEIKALILTK